MKLKRESWKSGKKQYTLWGKNRKDQKCKKKKKKKKIIIDDLEKWLWH